MKIKAPRSSPKLLGPLKKHLFLFLRKWKGISFCVLLLKLEANIAKIVLFRRGDNSLKSAILIFLSFIFLDGDQGQKVNNHFNILTGL